MSHTSVSSDCCLIEVVKVEFVLFLVSFISIRRSCIAPLYPTSTLHFTSFASPSRKVRTREYPRQTRSALPLLSSDMRIRKKGQSVLGQNTNRGRHFGELVESIGPRKLPMWAVS